jgi:hypothetical protein
MANVLVFENNRNIYTKVLEYDDKNTPINRHSFLIMVANSANFGLTGYTFQYNITKETHINYRADGEYVHYKAKYTYNAAGFPTAMRKIFMGSREANATYTFK